MVDLGTETRRIILGIGLSEAWIDNLQKVNLQNDKNLSVDGAVLYV